MPLATTKIWPVRDSLRRVVDYAANPDKTEYSGLAQALHYAENDAKTTLRETAQLVSGVHCRPGTAWAEMRAVQEQFGKTEGVVAMHAYQSFKPGEVTPEQCHSIGVELARRVWGGRFQVLVATHLNTGCLHNHFVINAVSYVDGKKYEQRRDQYREMRRVSDQLCREHALSVVRQPGGKKPRPLYEGTGQTRYEAMRQAMQPPNVSSRRWKRPPPAGRNTAASRSGTSHARNTGTKTESAKAKTPAPDESARVIWWMCTHSRRVTLCSFVNSFRDNFRVFLCRTRRIPSTKQRRNVHGIWSTHRKERVFLHCAQLQRP